jgi:hypothetical protein
MGMLTPQDVGSDTAGRIGFNVFTLRLFADFSRAKTKKPASLAGPPV